MELFKKRQQKITSNAEMLDIDGLISDLNNSNCFLNYGDEEHHALKQLIEEHKEQVNYKKTTGFNFFMVVIKAEVVEVFKNGFWFYNMNVKDVVVNKNETIDIKYIKSCKGGDYVEFYLDM